MTKRSDADNISDAIITAGNSFYSGLTNEEASISVRGGQLEDIGVHVDGIRYEAEHTKNILDSRLEDIADRLQGQNSLLTSIAASLVTIAKAMEARG